MNSINGQLFLSFTAITQRVYIVLLLVLLLLWPLLNCDLCVYAEKLDLCMQDSSFRSPLCFASECVYKTNEKLSHEVHTRCSLSFSSPLATHPLFSLSPVFTSSHRCASLSQWFSQCAFDQYVPRLSVCVCEWFRRERFMLAIKKLYCSIRSLARAH